MISLTSSRPPDGYVVHHSYWLSTLRGAPLPALFYHTASRERRVAVGRYVGSLYYDSSFWPIAIPVVADRVKLDASKSLRTMPEPIKARLMRDRHSFINYAAFVRIVTVTKWAWRDGR